MSKRRRLLPVRFIGEIAAFGTTLGHRIVVGRWTRSPFGPFTDIMHEQPTGRRVLYAPSEELGRYVGDTYEFDEVRVTPIDGARTPSEMSLDAPGWTISLTIGRRTTLGRALRIVPRAVATAPWWCSAVDPIARVVLRDVRTRGTAREGRVEWYGAVDHHRIEAVRVEHDGDDLGTIADVDPPVRFGFSSAPRRPSIVEITTTIRDRGHR